MNVLVTGGSGFIGSHIVDVLIEEGHVVKCLDIKPPLRGDIAYINGSILDRELIDSALKECDAVFHVGGFSNINFVKGNPVGTIELNTLSTTYLLEACRKKTPQPHFIYASSVYVFDRNGHLYTTSKACSERIIEDYSSLYGVPYTILRYGTVYGPRSREADVIYLFVKNALDEKTIKINGDGTQTRNFIHVRDLAVGSVKVLKNEKAKNKTLVIANPISVSINDLAEIVSGSVSPNVEIKYTGEGRQKDYEGGVDGVEKSQDILGWKCRISLETGIEELRREMC